MYNRIHSASTDPLGKALCLFGLTTCKLLLEAADIRSRGALVRNVVELESGGVGLAFTLPCKIYDRLSFFVVACRKVVEIVQQFFPSTSLIFSLLSNNSSLIEASQVS
jgi:hypothetical protein